MGILSRLFGHQKPGPASQRTFQPRVEHPAVHTCLKEQLYRVVDIETTGLNPQWDAVCEIGYAIIRGDGTVVGAQSTLINPGKSISPAATAVNGIRNEDVAGMPTLVEAVYGMPELYEPPLPLVAHNVQFDLEFLSRICLLAAANPTAICTLEMARELLPDLDRYDLVSLREALGIVDEYPNLPAHRAADDVAAVSQLFSKLLGVYLKSGGPDDVQSLAHRYGFTKGVQFGCRLSDEEVGRNREYIEYARNCAAGGHQPLAGLHIVVTGELRLWSRVEIECVLQMLGARVTTSVSSKTKYVVAGARAGSKLRRAALLGIPVLDERGFMELARKGGVAPG
jgi:DNA polymerase III epsilon subunit-like protein